MSTGAIPAPSRDEVHQRDTVGATGNGDRERARQTGEKMIERACRERRVHGRTL